MTTIRMIVSALALIGSVFMQEPCPNSESGLYAPETELCCKNKLRTFIADRFNGDKLEQNCCGNTTYVLATQICCDSHVFHKLSRDNKEYECCGGSYYIPKENKKICCNQILHDKQSADEHCCGTHVINRVHVCCRDKVNPKIKMFHIKEAGKRCCGTDYYSKTTHHCYRRQHVLPSHHKLCGDVEYDIRKQKCCGRALYNYSENTPHYKCCGSKLYNDIDHRCCHRDGHTIPHDASCCGTTHYYENTQKCCDDVPIKFLKDTESCCGKGLYDTLYQSCCGSTPYNTSSYECCKPDGDIIPRGTHDRCCSTDRYDSTKQVCCIDYTDPTGPKTAVHMKPSDKPFHDQCCATPFLQQKQSYASITHLCSLNGTVIPRGDMCGDIPYNTSIDLCCDGVLDKRGEEKGRGCCGVSTYYKASQICCQKEVFFLKDRPSCKQISRFSRKPKRELPKTRSITLDQNYGICQYCYRDQDENIKLLKSKKDLCKHKAMKIRVDNETTFSNKVIVEGALRKDLFSTTVYRRKPINIHLPCPCTLKTGKAILLTDIDDYSKPVRLGDSDMIMGWTKRINNLIRRKWKECQKDETRLAIDYVSKIKTFVDFTSIQLKRKEQLR